jgi:predicted negative regulator of RcsB-dependent stress response
MFYILNNTQNIKNMKNISEKNSIWIYAIVVIAWAIILLTS